MKKNSISQKQLREFGLLTGFGFPIFIGWIIPMISGYFFRSWSLWVGFPLLMLGILKPSWLLYPYKAWMALGLSLGWVNSHVILGLIHLIVLQPIALIMKIFRYDPLREKKNNKSTYRENKANHVVDLKRIF